MASEEELSWGWDSTSQRIWIDTSNCDCAAPGGATGPIVLPHRPTGLEIIDDNPPPPPPPPPPGEKRWPSGIIHLLSASGGHFISHLQGSHSLTRPWIDGFRCRTGLDLIKPNGIFGASDWSQIDDAITICSDAGKIMTLNISMGVDMPSDFYSASPATGSIVVTSDGSGGTSTIPLIWEESFFTKISPVIAEFGARYDSNPTVSAVFFTGYQQQVECHVCATQTDRDNYNAAAVSAGFADKSAAWIPQVKRIIDLYMAAFPNTVLLSTAGNPWGGDNGNQDRKEAETYMFTTYPTKFGGLCSSFLHATLVHTGIPDLVQYPTGDQAIFASSDDTRFYSPPLPGSQPPPPKPIFDLCENGFDHGDQYVEVYEDDIENSLNDETLIAESLRLKSNLPISQQ